MIEVNTLETSDMYLVDSLLGPFFTIFCLSRTKFSKAYEIILKKFVTISQILIYQKINAENYPKMCKNQSFITIVFRLINYLDRFFIF